MSAHTEQDADHGDRLLVQVASYNTNLQGIQGLPQDLVDWLSPTLQVSKFLSTERRAPDIVAVGFQELLPLHLGLCGFSKSVIENRNALILSQIEEYAPMKEKYALVAKIVNVGVALLVYVRDETLASRIADVQTSWTGCGPGFMGNKGAVGIRFRVTGENGGVGESFTFVCAHLTAHEYKLANRIADYHHITSTLLFPPTPYTPSSGYTSMFATSHLFFFGDLNFRVSLPASHPLAGVSKRIQLAEAMSSAATREEVKEYDQLLSERRKGTVFAGLREGEFWKFKCSYKYTLGEVDRYSSARTPSWTDRILYTTHTDSPNEPEESGITNILYTSIPSYTTSDHKPIVALLLLPKPTVNQSETVPLLRLPSHYKCTPDPRLNMKRYSGRSLDRAIGIVWWLLTVLGGGYPSVGIVNVVLGVAIWRLYKVFA